MNVRVLSAILFVMLSLGMLPARADDVPDAATLLDRVQKAEGVRPENVRSVIRSHGTDGDEIETTYRIGKNVRTIWSRGPITTQEGTYDGDDWTRDENGLTVADEPDPDEAAEAAAFTTTVKRSTAPDAYVIEKLEKNGYGTRTFIDPTTYHELREDEIGANGTVTTTYSDYRTFGTVTLATKWTETNAATSESTDYERTDYTIGAVEPLDVAVPNPRASVTFPDGISHAVLPTQFDGGKIEVHADIAGHRSEFYLDTGAAGITITEGKAKQLGLTTYNPHRNDLNAGAYVEREAIIPVIRIGQLELHDVVVSITPKVGDDDDEIGLLGFDFLAELGVRIDYEQRKVTVVDAAHFVPPTDKNLIAIDVRLGTLQPMTSVVFEGVPANRMVVDTGAAGTFMLQDHFARRHPEVLHTRASGEANFVGVGGAFDTDSWHMKRIKWGPIEFKDFIGYRVISKKSYANDEDGLIGYDLLRFFTVVLDYMDGRIYLTQNHGSAESDGADY
jgi:predicted aspartyl protease